MESFRLQGIILHALNFRDFDQILSVFSADHGLVKFVFKGANSPRRKKGATTSPLTHAEFMYRKGNSDLLTCQELSVISHNLELRKDLGVLEVACSLIQVLRQTLFPEKPVPHLYQLLIRYLNALPQVTSPEALEASFLLKLLRHEGHLGPLSHCGVCGASLSDLYLVGGESFCKKHTPHDSQFFSEDEKTVMYHLAFCRSISEIGTFPLPDELHQKIKTFFTNCIF